MVSCTAKAFPMGDALGSHGSGRFTVIEGGCNKSGKARRASLFNSQNVALLSVSLILIFALAAMWRWSDRCAAARVEDAFSSISYETITVMPGDTIWQIAETHPVQGCTTYEVVRHIAEANELPKGPLSVGLSLVVPNAA